MKKIITALTLVSLFVLSFSAISANAAYRAPYLSQYVEESAPAAENRHYLPIDGGQYYMEWNLTPENILDGYNPTENASYNNIFANGIGQMDNNAKVVGFNFAAPVTAAAFVFADGFTTTGAHYGASRIKPSDWEERFTFYTSLDGENWSQVPFTVSFHYESSEFSDVWMGNTTGNIDLFWHINFEAPVTAQYYMLHTNNTSDQNDGLYELAIVCHADYWYLMYEKGTAATEAPATDAPATEPATTEAPATDAPATEAATTEAPATDAPATEASTTEAPETDAPVTSASDNNDDNSSIIGIVIAAIAVIAVVVIVVIVTKKRK